MSAILGGVNMLEGIDLLAVIGWFGLTNVLVAQISYWLGKKKWA